MQAILDHGVDVTVFSVAGEVLLGPAHIYGSHTVAELKSRLPIQKNTRLSLVWQGSEVKDETYLEQICSTHSITALEFTAVAVPEPIGTESLELALAKLQEMEQRIKQLEQCPACLGKGHAVGVCKRCGGDGCRDDGYTLQRCGSCSGTGEGPETQCLRCGGSGEGDANGAKAEFATFMKGLPEAVAADYVTMRKILQKTKRALLFCANKDLVFETIRKECSAEYVPEDFLLDKEIALEALFHCTNKQRVWDFVQGHAGTVQHILEVVNQDGEVAKSAIGRCQKQSDFRTLESILTRAKALQEN
eukprot:TRINITY_DN11017_c0_g2_i1.p1 TRINITY_DN11017_c0_g2~~TRINITY_DN11017_c0_g2_i1.p1  ORF type:complete len:304 (-),score=54.93 TRINITY_DN11017_c0_g2_i1:601-1512(-)